MEELLASSPLSQLKEGSIIRGTIKEIRPKEILIDIGAKSLATVKANEFLDLDELEVGSDIEVLLERIENVHGNPIISYDKAQQKKNWENILNHCQEGGIVSGRVKDKVKGGLMVSVGVDAFLPSSQIDLQAPKNLDQYIGQTFDLKVVKINFDRKNIIVSRRELIEEQRTEKRRQLLDRISEGDTCQGVVKNITDYGAFVDLDGLDGLIHVTDMSWGRVGHPGEVLKVGEEIQVKVLGIDREKERVSLGIKQLTNNPWDNIQSKYPVGAKVQGRVVSLTSYGAFIELEKGVEGLIHITEMSWVKRVARPGELFKVGQTVEAVVMEIQKEAERISLSYRQLETSPWEMAQHNYPVGARVRGKVRSMKSYGAFVALEPGVDGMVHVSDMSWTRKINNPSEMLKEGEEVDAIVLDVNVQQQRISLGMKQLTEDPWDQIDHYYKVGDIVTGKVSKITNYGAFVSLQQEIDGLVHISQLNEERVEKVKDIVNMGQEVTARVIKIDREERRIGLSIKAANYSTDQFEAEALAYEKMNKQDDLNNLGDLLDQAQIQVTDSKADKQ